MPKMVNTNTVNILIGMIKFKGEAIKLYAYKIKALMTILFNT